LVLGITARFRFDPPAVTSFNKKQKHLKNCIEVPYSSEANKKEKSKLGVLG
jgi:hypothetical protein